MHLDGLPFQYSRGELHEWLGAYVSKPFEVRRGECRGRLKRFWPNLWWVACYLGRTVDFEKFSFDSYYITYYLVQSRQLEYCHWRNIFTWEPKDGFSTKKM